MTEEVEFTEEELAMLDGKDVDDESASPDAPTVESVPVVEAVPAVAEAEESELDRMKKANTGILNELVSLRRDSREDREWRKAVEGRMETLTGALEQPEEVASEPDKDEEPLEWVLWKQQEAMKEGLKPLEKLTEEKAAEEEYGVMLQEAGRMAQAAERDVISSGSVTEEQYHQNLDEIRFERMRWYAATGSSPQEAASIVQEEERQFVFSNLAEGKNPAAEAMKLHASLKPHPLPGKEEAPVEEAKPEVNIAKVQAARDGAKQNVIQNVSGTGGQGGTITYEQFSEMDQDDPLWQKIAGSDKLFAELNVYGQVTV